MRISGIGTNSDHGTTPSKGSGFTPYHHGKKVRRARGIPLEEKPFIAWDGEGVNIRGEGYPQSYVLFGNSTGHYISSEEGLSTIQCLEHIVETGLANPHAVHIGFAFTYDANMIVQSLSPTSLGRLHVKGSVRIRTKVGVTYTITFLRGKSFRVTKYYPQYDREHNPTAKITVQIYDIFSFFMCSFEKAYTKMIGPVPLVVTQGKADRGKLGIEDLSKITEYWSQEVVLVQELAEQLRRHVYNANLRISQWHGPGALSSYAMKREKIQDHMAETSPEIREASRYAYAAGRFEIFKVGRTVGRIYGIDKRSAYPTAIALLPSLRDGEWVHVTNPEKVRRFGIYRTSLSHFAPMAKQPSPVFHRDKEHNISFPWHVNNWYWSPEAHVAQLRGGRLIEGWEYRGSRDLPFWWVPEIYDQRLEWKLRGISAEMALKLLLNSIYGKLAQRVGWDEMTRRKPPFHQLEWAGFVTSYTRAAMYMVMSKIPFDKLIAIETDGIYTTVPPEELGITVGTGLGEWEVKEYRECMYVQSGLAWLQKSDGTWEEKRRGLDPCRKNHDAEDCHCPGTFSLNACRDYLDTLIPGPEVWPAYKGQTSRFVGLGQALSSARPMGQRHCVWETMPREITPGTRGKRVHVANVCDACKAGRSAYDDAHDLVIRSRSALEPNSYPHAIPWEDNLGYVRWRDYEESENDYVTSQYV